MSFPPTVASVQNVSYRFRLIVGWCKQNTVLPISSGINAGNLPNGIVIQEVKPEQSIPLYDDSSGGGVVPRPSPLETVQRAIDDTNDEGLHQIELAYPKNKFMLISDRTME
eukprot:SAG11_NODE_16923_length_533_cov_1.550691_1_plen_110_part_10